MGLKSSYMGSSWQALRSLGAAFCSMYPKHNPVGVQRVDMRWAVEREPSCQKILSSTYGTCVFGDIMELDSKKPNLYCHTHKKHCPLHVPKTKGRISADYINAWVSTKMPTLVWSWVIFQHRTLYWMCWCKPYVAIWFTMLHQGTRVNLTGLGYAKNMLASKRLSLNTSMPCMILTYTYICCFGPYDAIPARSTLHTFLFDGAWPGWGRWGVQSTWKILLGSWIISWCCNLRECPWVHHERTHPTWAGVLLGQWGHANRSQDLRPWMCPC